MNVSRYSFFTFLTAVIIAFTACSQAVPQIKYSSSTVIFEYDKEDSLPQARFSVFAESTSNVRRYSNITVKPVSSNLIWEADILDNISIFAMNDKQYAGFSNFVMPDGQEIIQGEYTVTFKNSDEQETVTKTHVNYDSAFYKTKASEVPELMNKKAAKKQIIIYDENYKVLYYGDRGNELGDTRQIWNKYRNAKVYREIYMTNNKNVICILPEKQVAPEKE